MIRFITITNLLISVIAFASHPITLDGLFDDWQDVPVAVNDANEMLIEDFAKLQITNDDNLLFLRFVFFQNEYLLQDQNKITLLIDADNNKETGHPINEMGVEVEWCFGCRAGNYYVMDGIIPISQSDIVLRSAPTVTAQQFEIAIGLNSWPMQQENSTKPDTIRVLLSNSNGSDTLPNDPMGFQYVIDKTPVEPPEEMLLGKNDVRHLRIMTYNMLASGLLDSKRVPHFQRIITALEPDVMAFQEQGSVNTVRSLLSGWLQTQTLYSVQIGNSNIIVSRYPVLQQAILTRSGRTMAALLDTKSILGNNLLIINSHLACCTNNASRQNDADELISVLREWRSGFGPFELEEYTPIVHVGDFNLVGYSQQLRTLRDGDILNETDHGPDFYPDWDNTPFVDLFSRHTSVRMGYTWRDDNSSFNPGKLDYILYSDSNLKLGKHFVLNTLAMSEELLSRKGLLAKDTQKASDHLPRVLDIAGLKTMTVVEDKVENSPYEYEIFSAYPNPFNQSTKIQFYMEKRGHVNLTIYNLNGQVFDSLVNRIVQPGWHSLLWDAQNVPSGVYLCRFSLGNRMRSLKLVVQK